MQNLDRKLESGNSALIAQVFSQLILTAQSKNSAKGEFGYLKGKCLSDSGCISDTARLSIIQLIERNLLQVDQVLAECVTSISTTSNVNSLAKLIANVLHLQLAQGTNKQYQLSQHPLIKILQEDYRAEVQMCIYNEVAQSCLFHASTHDLHEPLYLHCICSPLGKIELGLLRHKLWSFLITYDEQNETSWICKMCCWLQIENRHAEQAGSLLDEVLQRHRTKDTEYLIFLQILVVRNMIERNADCRLAITTLLGCLAKVVFSFSSAALLILSKALLVCSPVCLEALLTLCLAVANQKTCNLESYLALKSVLIHWLAAPSLLTETALEIGQDILNLHEKAYGKMALIKASRLPTYRSHYLLFSNPELFLNVQLAIKIDCTKKSDIFSLLGDFQAAPMHFVRANFTFLCGLLLNQKLSTVGQLQVLTMIVSCSSQYQELLPTVLSLILYKLSNTEDTQLHFELLKALPAMAQLKDNVPKVIATIRAISQHSAALSNFALRLLYDTWQIDTVAYSALEDVAMNSAGPAKGPEYDITRAWIFRQLSERRPEVYGKDLVAILSKILNECSSKEGAVATALALEAIHALCKAEIIDIVTTWGTLAPKFKLDKRIPVLKSLCGLLGEIPHLEYAQSYEKLINDVVEHLWKLADESQVEEVQNAAFQALSAFSLDAICRHIPSAYLEEKSDKDSLGIAGKTWVNLLAKHQSKEAARKFLTKLVANEVDNYLKYVYQLKSRQEPDNYRSLPTTSIVRALTEFLKQHFLKAKDWENHLFIDCLAILSTKYSKPLPPLDWSFLLDLIHVDSLRSHCLDLAAHQAVVSGSSRRLVETFIIGVTENPQFHSALHVYRNLIHIANSIQPVVLRPFLQNSLHTVQENGQLEVLLAHLKEVLEDKNVQEVNKSTIEEVLREIIFVADVSTQRFSLLLSAVSSFSHKGLTKILVPTAQKVSEREFAKILKITSHISKNSQAAAPLDWLNALFATAFHSNIKPQAFVEDLTCVLKRRLNNEESPAWLNDRFGEIQVKVADNCDIKETEQLCDILAISVVCLSGLNVLLPNNDVSSIKRFFPAALACLLDELTWSSSTMQILEWIHYMSGSESISEEYRRIFGWSLAALRHQEEFSKSSRWTKYFDCKICTLNEP